MQKSNKDKTEQHADWRQWFAGLKSLEQNWKRKYMQKFQNYLILFIRLTTKFFFVLILASGTHHFHTYT